MHKYLDTCTHTHLMASFSRTTWVSWYQKCKTSLDLNEARDDGVLGCSGISWTICSLHLAPGRQPHQHNNNNNDDRLTAFDPGQPG